MYAIIEDGGRQYKIEEGQVVYVDVRDVEGGKITFDRVIFLQDDSGTTIGQPMVSGAKVTGTVSEELATGPKLYPMQFRRRKKSRRRIGHRQKYLEVAITAISK